MLLSDELAKKYGSLVSCLDAMGSVLVAYSGGVDSSLLLKVALDRLPTVLAVTASSPTIPTSEVDAAAALARDLGARHLIITSHEMEDDFFRANPPDRCYYCKRELFTKLENLAAKHGIIAVVEGSNADDDFDFRPGRKAARELGVRSPLQEAKLSKAEVRQLARLLGLANWDKASQACLSSRIPYGEPITNHKLNQVEEAEAFLSRLGFQGVRVRHYGHIARLEMDPSDFRRVVQPTTRTEVVKRLHDLGFVYITLDLEGFRSGSMNLVLSEDVN